MNPDAWWWRIEHELLAQIVELTDARGRETVQSLHTKDVYRGARPVHIPRPGEKAQRAEKMSRAQRFAQRVRRAGGRSSDGS